MMACLLVWQVETGCSELNLSQGHTVSVWKKKKNTIVSLHFGDWISACTAHRNFHVLLKHDLPCLQSLHGIINGWAFSLCTLEAAAWNCTDCKNQFSRRGGFHIYHDVYRWRDGKTEYQLWTGNEDEWICRALELLETESLAKSM